MADKPSVRLLLCPSTTSSGEYCITFFILSPTTGNVPQSLELDLKLRSWRKFYAVTLIILKTVAQILLEERWNASKLEYTRYSIDKRKSR